MTQESTPETHLDPGRWVTLTITIVAAFIVVLDNSVLTVAIPTILRELHTTLPSVEWVVTGYALTFATLLIIGGRLGDVFGHRRMFIIGVALFGAGSLVASISHSVAELIIGEAVIEGIGAALMLPATLAILSGTFRGAERAKAFAAWGATAGIGAACGPIVGGFLTTNYSWRWSFRINVIVAPLAIIGAMLFMKLPPHNRQRASVDIGGAFLIAVGTFLLVFSLSQGGVYGWWQPIEDFRIGTRVVWPTSRAVSIIPIMVVASILVLGLFAMYERRRERLHKARLFDLADLQRKSYRYGLLTGLVLAMGQLGLGFVLPVFLQNAKHLSAQTNGMWLLPTGIFVIIGAQLGSRVALRLDTTMVVRIGLLLYAAGMLLVIVAVRLDVTWWQLAPGLALYGAGGGFAGAQLSNVVLSEVPAENAGVASGANSSVRQVGSALGVAVIGSLLAAATVRSGISRVNASTLPANVKETARAGIRSLGSNYRPPSSLTHHDASILRGAIENGAAYGTRFSLAFVLLVVLGGAVLSLLIPRTPNAPAPKSAIEIVESVESVTPLEPSVHG